MVDILVLSDLHKAVELKATAISFLLAHKEEVFSQPDWKIKLKVGCPEHASLARVVDNIDHWLILYFLHKKLDYLSTIAERR